MADTLSPSIPQRGPLYHKVALKVLRLARPKILPPKLLVDEEENPSSRDPPLLLSLPQTFANLYVGETFRCVLSLDSESDDGDNPVAATLAVSISTPNREHPIAIIHPSQPDSMVTLGPRETKQYIVEFETHDPGIHVISAVVTYTSPKEESTAPATFTKNYRFTAENGLYVRTKISTITPESCTLEAQIENITDSTMTLETAEFLPPAGWISHSLTFEDEAASNSPANKQITTPSLMPKETWQFAYIVSQDPDYTDARQTVGMGKFSVSWRRENLGEKGWLMTGHLKRSPGIQ